MTTKILDFNQLGHELGMEEKEFRHPSGRMIKSLDWTVEDCKKLTEQLTPLFEAEDTQVLFNGHSAYWHMCMLSKLLENQHPAAQLHDREQPLELAPFEMVDDLPDGAVKYTITEKDDKIFVLAEPQGFNPDTMHLIKAPKINAEGKHIYLSTRGPLMVGCGLAMTYFDLGKSLNVSGFEDTFYCIATHCDERKVFDATTF